LPEPNTQKEDRGAPGPAKLRWRVRHVDQCRLAYKERVDRKRCKILDALVTDTQALGMSH